MCMVMCWCCGDVVLVFLFWLRCIWFVCGWMCWLCLLVGCFSVVMCCVCLLMGRLFLR